MEDTTQHTGGTANACSAWRALSPTLSGSLAEHKTISGGVSKQ